jgi:hypothetical protein
MKNFKGISKLSPVRKEKMSKDLVWELFPQYKRVIETDTDFGYG